MVRLTSPPSCTAECRVTWVPLLSPRVLGVGKAWAVAVRHPQHGRVCYAEQQSSLRTWIVEVICKQNLLILLIWHLKFSESMC